MPNWVIDLLTQLQAEIEEYCPFVFLTVGRWEKVKSSWNKFNKQCKEHDWQNKMLQNNQLRDFKRYSKNAGIKTNEKLNQHCLRKSWACNLANSSVPVHTLMKLGGWSSIETCQQFYLQTSDANEQKAVEALDKLMINKTAKALPTGMSWTQDRRRRGKNGVK